MNDETLEKSETPSRPESGKDLKRSDGICSMERIQVLRTVTHVGCGTPQKPYRYVTQLWTMDGELLMTEDPFIQKTEKEEPKHE